MIVLGLDGADVPVLAFMAAADERQQDEGRYRLDVLLPDGRNERCWAQAVAVQSYRRIAPCGGAWPWT